MRSRLKLGEQKRVAHIDAAVVPIDVSDCIVARLGASSLFFRARHDVIFIFPKIRLALSRDGRISNVGILFPYAWPSLCISSWKMRKYWNSNCWQEERLKNDKATFYDFWASGNHTHLNFSSRSGKKMCSWTRRIPERILESELYKSRIALRVQTWKSPFQAFECAMRLNVVRNLFAKETKHWRKRGKKR